jgi:hypothetical protein
MRSVWQGVQVQASSQGARAHTFGREAVRMSTLSQAVLAFGLVQFPHEFTQMHRQRHRSSGRHRSRSDACGHRTETHQALRPADDARACVSE